MSLQVAQSTSVFGVFCWRRVWLGENGVTRMHRCRGANTHSEDQQKPDWKFQLSLPKKLDRRMENRGLANVIRGHVGLTSIRYNNYFTKETGGSWHRFWWFGQG